MHLRTLASALRGSAPRGASRDGPPAPRRLGQPSPYSSPISDAPRRRRGHCLAGSRTGGKLARHAPCSPHRGFTRVTKTATTPRLATRHRDNRNAFRRVSIDRVAPADDAASAFLFECAAPYRAPFSPRSRRLVCQHVGAESSSTSVASPIRLAAPRASRRAMRQTDFCLLTFFVRAPAPRRFPMRHALARLRDRGDRLLHTSAIRFGGPHDSIVSSPRWAFSSRRDACGSVPLASLSPLPRVSCRSRDLRIRGSRRDRPRPDRVNVRAGGTIRDAFHRARTIAPQRPFGRPAREFPGFAAWPPRLRISAPFHLRETLRSSRRPGPRPRAPLPTGDTLLWTSAPLADFCNLNTTRGHTQRAFDPRTRVGLSPRYSPAPTDAGCVGPGYVAASGACEPRHARAGLRTTCSTRVDRADRGPRRSSKGEPRALGRCRACPSRGASGTRVTGSIGDEAWRTSSLVVPA
jgi:hypothetical protein